MEMKPIACTCAFVDDCSGRFAKEEDDGDALCVMTSSQEYRLPAGKLALPPLYCTFIERTLLPRREGG